MRQLDCLFDSYAFVFVFVFDIFVERRLRDTMLTEMVARTLKNILRSFQRGWMKAERSTSEQGMSMLGKIIITAIRSIVYAPLSWYRITTKRRGQKQKGAKVNKRVCSAHVRGVQNMPGQGPGEA